MSPRILGFHRWFEIDNRTDLNFGGEAGQLEQRSLEMIPRSKSPDLAVSKPHPTQSSNRFSLPDRYYPLYCDLAPTSARVDSTFFFNQAAFVCGLAEAFHPRLETMESRWESGRLAVWNRASTRCLGLREAKQRQEKGHERRGYIGSL